MFASRTAALVPRHFPDLLHEQPLHLVRTVLLVQEPFGTTKDVFKQIVVAEFEMDQQVEQACVYEKVLPQLGFGVVQYLVQPEQRLVHLAGAEMGDGQS